MEEIKQAIKDLELQLNYICYDPVMIDKLSSLWDKLQVLQDTVNKNNLLSDVSKRSELLIDFYYKLGERLDTNLPPISIDKIVDMYEKGNL